MVHQYEAALDAFTGYHLEQEEKQATSVLGGPALPALGHAISGAAGAAIANVVSYPLSLCITRLQVQKQLAQLDEQNAEKSEYRDVFDAAQKIYEQEGGLSALYAGCLQDTTKTVLDSFLFFLAYNFVRKGRLQSRAAKRLPPLEEIGVGMVAGAFAKLITTPISNIVTRKQTAAMFRSTGSRKLTVGDIAAQIRRDKGLKGFWSGYSASLILTINPALTMLLHNTLLRMFVARALRENPGSTATFLLAATSKAIASSLTYPFQLAKSRAQVSNKKPVEPPAPSEKLSTGESFSSNARRAEKQVEKDTIVGTVLEIARTEGVAGLYQGLSGEIAKGFFTHGLTMLIKERIHVFVIQLYYFVLKAMKKYPAPSDIAEKAQEGAIAVKDNVTETLSKVRDSVTDTVTARKEEVGDPYRLKITSDQLEEVARRSQRSVGDVRDKVKEMSDRVVDIMVELIVEGKQAKADFAASYVGFDEEE